MYSVDHILRIVATELPAVGVEALLIGGFAVNHYGYSRNTLDIDFMVKEGDQRAVREVMTRNGFVNRSETDNVVFYGHPGGGLRVDLLSVDVATFDKLMQNAETVLIGESRLRVPSLRDLLAMKVFALAQSASARWDKDLPDIAYLCVLNDLSLDDDVKPLCNRYANK